MLIREEHGDKRHHLTLLLLADEQESMVDRYLDEGTMYVWKSTASWWASAS